MAGLAYTYIPLENATLIQRRHPRDVKLPGVVEFNNLYISRSDDSIALRPDFEPTTEEIMALGTRLKDGSVDAVEFLNSAIGLYGTGEIVWITSPLVISGDGRDIKSSILGSGSTTISLSTDDREQIDESEEPTNYLLEMSSDAEINALEDIWAGCYILIGDDPDRNFFRISSIKDSTSFYIDDEPEFAVSGNSFTIYRTHNIVNSVYKANLQVFGSQLVYAIPSITDNSFPNNIAGPFYTTSIDGSSASASQSYALSFNDSLTDSIVNSSTNPKFIVDASDPDDGTRYFGYITPLVDVANESDTPYIYMVQRGSNIVDSTLDAVEDTLFAGTESLINYHDVCYDGTYFYLSGSTRTYDSTTLSDGFEVADGHTVGEKISADEQWTNYAASGYSDDAVVASDGGEQCFYCTQNPAALHNQCRLNWYGVDTPYGGTGQQDLYARFKTTAPYSGTSDFGMARIGVYMGSSKFSINFNTTSNNFSLTRYYYNTYYHYWTESSVAEWGTCTAGTVYWMRLSYIDNAVKAKTWTGDRGDEPVAWNATYSQYNAFIGARPYIAISNYHYDDYGVVTLRVYEIDYTTATDDFTYTNFVHRFTNEDTPTLADKSPSITTTYSTSGSLIYDDAINNLIFSMNRIGGTGSLNYVRYSADGGGTWLTAATTAGHAILGMFYSAIDTKTYALTYTVSGSTYTYQILKTADGGATWSSYAAALTGPETETGGSWSGTPFFWEDDTNWCMLISGNVGNDDNLWYVFGGDTALTAAEDNSAHGGFTAICSKYSSCANDGTNYDDTCIGMASSGYYAITIDTSTAEVEKIKFIGGSENSRLPSNILPLNTDSWDSRQYVSFSCEPPPDTPGSVFYDTITFSASPGSETEPQVDVFVPVSNIYRSNTFSVLNGYLVLFGTLEYDTATHSWTYNPRRARWTAPNTITDFSGVGSGTGDVTGNGIFIDARPVNGRIVTFESSSIGALVPRGIVADPWDYDVIYDGIRLLSNPCVVGDKCYFIASDGLLYVTNGISVTEAGSSFDTSLYDDFEENKPIFLTYLSNFNSLVAFYPDGTSNTAYLISLATGGVCSFELSTTTASTTEDPQSIVAIESSSDQRLIVSYSTEYGLTSSSDGFVSLVTTQLSTGEKITGKDYSTNSVYDTWCGNFETGNIFIVDEGVKVALKHVIIHTYTDAASVGDNPDIIVEVKSLEDSDWHGPRDNEIDGAVTVTTSACTIDSSDPPSALSNLLGTANGTAITYNLPWIAANCRVYTYSSTYTACTLVTTTPDAANEYQITGTQQIKVYGTNGHSVYCFCDNEPSVKVGAGDYIETDEGFHRINSVTSYVAAVLDKYKSSGSDTDAVHYTAEQMPIGHGQVKVGINKLVEGVQLRIYILPRHGTGTTDIQPTIAKITGISLGYIPLGEKIVEATGG